MREKIETERLYYDDCCRTTFQSVVARAGEDEKGSYVILEETCFFPEGGGQPSDTGKLNGTAVTDVQIKDGEILHYISGNLCENDTVEGIVDWNRRFDLMQQHSGEHIVSGWIHSRFGYDNVGFHMGEQFITIDLNGEISPAQLADIENEVNQYIWTDREVRAFFASEEEVNTLPYRSKIELAGEVRLVEFPGADLCACCGLHVKRTGEIGLVKLVSVHHFRQGVRIEMLSGKRAFDYLNQHSTQNGLIAVDLSVKPDRTRDAVTKIQEENYRLRGEIIRLEREKYKNIARRTSECKDVLIIAEDMNPADIRKCTDEVLNTCQGVCVLVSGDDERGFRYAAGVRSGDIRDLVKDMNRELSGRGGGKPSFAQGSLKGAGSRIELFFKERDFSIIKTV